MKELYPSIEPYAVHRLDVGGGHSLYVEECGNPDGIPVVFLHGGPGSGCKSYHRSFFHPQRYRAILFDQRGAGRSKPQGRLESNTTSHLLGDLERIREYLRVRRWLLFGGSWGATLALVYAQSCPDRVSGMVLRGSFLARRRDLDWYIKDGANRIYPERWAESFGMFGGDECEDLIAALHSRIVGKDELAQRRCARAWFTWGGQVAVGDDFDLPHVEEHVSAEILHQARIELHYGFHRYFLEDNQILRNAQLLPEVPTILIHGRRDLVCPVEAAVSLRRHIPFADLRILPHAGHIASTPEMIDALVGAADEVAQALSRSQARLATNRTHDDGAG